MNNRITGTLTICLLVIVLITLAVTLPPSSTPKRLVTSAVTRVEAAAFRSPLSKAAGGVFDTTDRYLEDLQISDPAEKVLSVFADVPPDDAMVFITSGADAETDLAYLSISYLGWPRQIGRVRCNPDGSAGILLEPSAERPIRWLFFHRIAPPNDLTPQSKPIGQRLKVAPISEPKKWELYCSQ